MSYFLEGGLESQSPLDKDNYKPVRVDNTLRLDPPFN